MTIPSWIKNNFGRWTQTSEDRWIDKPKPAELRDEEIISEEKKNFKPPTQKQLEQLLNLIVDIIEQQASLKAQIAGLLSIAKKQMSANDETKAAIDLLFGRVIELEQAITNAEIEIPRANKVIN